MEEAEYLGRGGEFQSRKTGYVRIKNEDEEKVMRVTNMTTIPEVPLEEGPEELKDWKRQAGPEGKIFWKSERTGKMLRTLPKFEEEKPEEEVDPGGVVPWSEVRRRRRKKEPEFPKIKVAGGKPEEEEGLVARVVDLREVRENFSE